MEIANEFTVDAPIDVAWTTLTDIPFIAPCMPGATLEGQPGYGVADGNTDLDDLGFYLNAWLAGCN